MRVFDCFPFFNELDVLEWRLQELEDVVDTFILVESKQTFRLTEKPLYFESNRRRYSRWRKKISNWSVSRLADKLVPEDRMYEIEGVQRRALSWGLVNEDAQPTDLVLISDVDEIPRASRVRELKQSLEVFMQFADEKAPWFIPYKFEQDLYYYALNVRFPHEQVNGQPWYGTRLMSYAMFQYLGGMNARIYDPAQPVPQGGWHFSFFGGQETMLEKVRAWSHASAFIPEPLDPEGYMTAAREHAADWDPKRQADLEFVPILPQTHPRHVCNDLSRWRDHVTNRQGVVLEEGGVLALERWQVEQMNAPYWS